MRKFRLSVCKGLTCREGGAEAVFRAACDEIRRAGLSAHCEARRGGCWGMCHLGPNVVMREEVGRAEDPFKREDYQLMGWEEETLYGAMTEAKVRRIILEHVRSGRPVEELVTEAAPAPAVVKRKLP